MDQDWQHFATQRAEFVSDRLRGLLSSGVDFLRTELGVDLGLKPEKYPSWAILSAAVIALTVLVVVAACGRRKRRAAPLTATTRSPRTAAETQIKATPPPKTVKTEPTEPKKKNKKKAADKQKAQENGQTLVAEPKEEIKVIKVTDKKKTTPPAPEPAPLQPPVDAKAKKNKKKPKPEVKANQDVSSSDGKEPDEGAWETKVSNREKRQQRKKEKGPGDSPESTDRASWKAEKSTPVPTTAPKKSKESSRPKAGKDDAVVAPVISNRIDTNTVNGGGLTEVQIKHQTQINSSNNEKRPVGKKAPVQKSRENSWKTESDGQLTGLEGRIKMELKPVNFTMLGLITSGGESRSQSNTERHSDAVDNEWSSNGTAAVDPSSDWNAPTEIWGNYEGSKTEVPVLKETPKPLGESNDDNDKADPTGSGKSKRRKKKKRPEEEGSATELIQESAPAEKNVTVKPLPHVPKEDVSKQNVPPPSSQKKSDQNWEPPKQAQKKKARRET